MKTDGQVYSTALNAATLATPPLPPTEEDSEEKNNVEAKTYLDDGFVFGLEGSGLERPRGKVSNVVLESDSLETQPYQVAATVGTLVGEAAIAIQAINHLISVNNGDIQLSLAQITAVTMSSYVLADLGSGILHWSVDNYGNGKTPIMGGIIAAFQGHHSAPWTITERGFSNNVHKLTIPFGVPTVLATQLLAGPSHPLVPLFFAVFCASEIMSQELHKWSHMTPSQCHPIVNFLQEKGAIIGRKAHAQHHTMPFEGKYCIVSGLCNDILDNSGFFRRLEHIIYKINGVEANS